MDITKLKNALQFAIPEELYDIDPGQIVYFVPKDGLNRRAFSNTLLHFYRVLERIYPDNNKCKVRFIPTNNELLMDTFAGRSPQEIGIPYKVIVSTIETIAGFASQYSGEEVEKIVARANNPSQRRMVKPKPISATVSPVVVSIDPKNKPTKAQASVADESSDDFDIGLLTKRPETQKEKDELIAKREQKIRKILWECAYLGIDLDLKGLADEVKLGKSDTEGYKLSLKMKPAKAGTIDCKIYVRENKELILKQPILKAVYLTFLSLEDGLVIETATPDFTKRIQKIYKSLPDREEKEDENDGTGILYVQYIQPKTLRGYMSEINTLISRVIPNGLVAIEFSIEGEKEKTFKVMRSTPAIRKQIIDTFNL